MTYRLVPFTKHRSAKPLRRSGSTLRHVAKRKIKSSRKLWTRRDRMRHFVGTCMYPNCRAHCTDVHECARGKHRSKCLKHPACWLYLCRVHHDEVQLWTNPAKQLGLRKLWRPRTDSRAIYLRVTGEAETYFSDLDVLEWSQHFAKQQRGWE